MHTYAGCCDKHTTSDSIHTWLLVLVNSTSSHANTLNRCLNTESKTAGPRETHTQNYSNYTQMRAATTAISSAH